MSSNGVTMAKVLNEMIRVLDQGGHTSEASPMRTRFLLKEVEGGFPDADPEDVGDYFLAIVGEAWGERPNDQNFGFVVVQSLIYHKT